MKAETKESKRMLIATILLSVGLAAVAQIMLKRGMVHVTAESGVFSPASVASLKSAAGTPLIWLGLIVFGLSALVWLSVLSRTDLSFAYPFAALTYIIILIYGKFLADPPEPVTALRWGGVLMIIAGLVLVSRTG